MKKLFILLLLPAQLVFAQNDISLNDCYKKARENYPNLKQAEIWQEITSLKKENLKTNYLPQVIFNGQATYQSDVTKVNVAMPGINIPSVSNSQYKAYAEIKQSIWDGGITGANAKLEDAILQSNLSQIEVELYQLNEQVSQAFFTALVMDKQKEVLSAQKKVLQEKLKAIQSGIENQIIEKSSGLALEAEILNLEQNEIQLEAGKKTAIQMLSILTGQAISESVSLKYEIPEVNIQNELARPELMLFSAQKTQLEKQSELLSKSRSPKLFGFGQVGYGRPGLNMLNDKFDTYYLVGVGLSWNAFDWKNTSRQKQVLQFQQQLIVRQEETFSQNMNLLLTAQSEQINRLENLLETDTRMVLLRSEIVQTSASKFENEAITISEYIQDVQAETIAKLNIELHRVQLNEEKEKYNLIKGNSLHLLGEGKK